MYTSSSQGNGLLRHTDNYPCAVIDRCVAKMMYTYDNKYCVCVCIMCILYTQYIHTYVVLSSIHLYEIL